MLDENSNELGQNVPLCSFREKVEESASWPLLFLGKTLKGYLEVTFWNELTQGIEPVGGEPRKLDLVFSETLALASFAALPPD